MGRQKAAVGSASLYAALPLILFAAIFFAFASAVQHPGAAATPAQVLGFSSQVPAATQSNTVLTPPLLAQSAQPSGVCANFCNGASGGATSCSSSTDIATGGTQLYSCDLSETLDTLYANAGTAMTSSTGGHFDISPANTVNDFNSQSTPPLLTCPAPAAKNPGDASYFYSGAVPYVAGDACSPLQTSDLKTTVDLQTYFESQDVQVTSVPGPTIETTVCKLVSYWLRGYCGAYGCTGPILDQVDDCTPVETTSYYPVSAELTEAVVNPKLKVTNAGNLELSDMAYSPMLQQASGNTISSDFSTDGYVFDRVPAAAQHSIWTWTAQFADFSGAPPDSQTVTQDGLISSYTWTDYVSCGETITNYCGFTYSLTSDTSLTAMNNVQTPFNIVAPDGAQSQITSPVIPYFTFNAAMPTPEGQTLSQSYDVFSPENYYSPWNSIEAFPVDTPGNVLLNYNGKYLLPLPGGALNDPAGFEYDLDFPPSSDVPVWPKSLTAIGVTNPYLANPISITGTDTGYIYVLNESKTITSTDYYLTVLKPTTEGYYNTSNYQASDMLKNLPYVGTQSEWNGNWMNYWSNVIAMQGNSMYVVKSIDLNKELSAYDGEINNQQGKLGGFVPINISVDANGDVFMTGSEGAVVGAGKPAIVEITDTLGQDPSQMKVITTSLDWSTASGAPVLPEIAVTYSGGLVFAANPDYGTVYVLAPSGSGIDSQYEINLTYGVSSTGNPSTGFGTAMLNVSYYLYNGGLYGVPMDGVAQTPNVVAADVDHTRDFDSAAYHHPLGLQEDDGYLYVLDDWRGYAGGSETCTINAFCGPTGGTQFDILSVRVLNSTGSNLPVDPTNFDDMWQSQTCGNPVWGSGTGATQASANKCYSNRVAPALTDPACSPAQCTLTKTTCDLPTVAGSTSTDVIGTQYSCEDKSSGNGAYYTLATGQYQGNSYPPYGWVLSADIAPNGGGQDVSFCSSASCTFNPGRMPSAYAGGYRPIGPQISVADGEITGASFSVNFNGTMDVLLAQPPETLVNGVEQRLKGLSCAITGLFLPCASSANPSSYSELITANLNILNYTKILGGNPPYSCYTDNPSDKPNYKGGCYYLDPIGGLSPFQSGEIAGPVYSFPDPLEYLESVGGAQTLSFAGAVSSSYPSGSGGNSQGCQSVIAGGQGCTSNPLYNAGPPSLTIQQDPVGWGQADTITGKADTNTDQVEILLDGAVMATNSGEATYTVCSNPSTAATTCPAPGTYTVAVQDTTAGGTPTSNSLTINPGPVLSMQSATIYVLQENGAQTCTSDLLTANVLDGGGGVTISIYDPSGNPMSASYGLPAGGTGSVSYTIPVSGGLCAALGDGTYTVTATGSGGSVSQSLYVISSSAAGSAPPAAEPQTLTTNVGGYVVVPYSYTYTLSQRWSNYAYQDSLSSHTESDCPCDGDGSCTESSGTGADCLDADFPAIPTVTNTIYSYALLNGDSDSLSATVEGGDTYLQNLGSGLLYVPNMSDAGLLVPPQLFYSVQNNRIFGTLYANDTGCAPSGAGLDCSSNYQYALNATRQYTYQVDTYAQAGGQGPIGYETLLAVPVTPALYGAGLVATSPQQQVVTTQNGIGFYYDAVNLPQFVALFDLYRAVTYASPLYLYLNSTQLFENGQAVNALGYHRITYVMEDRFGNKVMAPMDVDVANPVTVSLSVNAVVDQDNSNQTVLTVNGVVGSYSDFGTTFTPLPTSQPVYLYYNSNLNYVQYSPTHDPLDAVLCAYNLNNPLTQPCQQSDPMYVGRTTNAGAVTFATSYNSPGGSCNPPPNSLLARSWLPCNVRGSDGTTQIPSACPQTGGGAEQFCMPVYSNGTGECTSQLGLFAVVYPDANGNFGTTLTACGSRQDEIIAQYYGWSPEAQPIQTVQTPLGLSESNVNTPGSAGASGGSAVTVNELNYYYAPAQASTSFEIGLFELSYGDLGAAALGLGALAVLAILIAKRARRKKGAGGASRRQVAGARGRRPA